MGRLTNRSIRQLDTLREFAFALILDFVYSIDTLAGPQIIHHFIHDTKTWSMTHQLIYVCQLCVSIGSQEPLSRLIDRIFVGESKTW